MIEGNRSWSSRIFSRVSHGFEKGSPRMKSMLRDVQGTILSSLAIAEDLFFSERDSRSENDKRAVSIFSSAKKILSLSLRWIAFSVWLPRLCTQSEIRLIQCSSNHTTYSLVMSSGLHSKVISGLGCWNVGMLESLKLGILEWALGKHSRIDPTSSSVRMEGVPHQK